MSHKERLVVTLAEQLAVRADGLYPLVVVGLRQLVEGALQPVGEAGGWCDRVRDALCGGGGGGSTSGQLLVMYVNCKMWSGPSGRQHIMRRPYNENEGNKM